MDQRCFGLYSSRISWDKMVELVLCDVHVVWVTEANSPHDDAVILDSNSRSIDNRLFVVDRGMTHNKNIKVELSGMIES